MVAVVSIAAAGHITAVYPAVVVAVAIRIVIVLRSAPSPTVAVERTVERIVPTVEGVPIGIGIWVAKSAVPIVVSATPRGIVVVKVVAERHAVAEAPSAHGGIVRKAPSRVERTVPAVPTVVPAVVKAVVVVVFDIGIAAVVVVFRIVVVAADVFGIGITLGGVG